MNIEKIEEIIKNTNKREDIADTVKRYDKIFGSFYYSVVEYFMNEAERTLANNKATCLIKDVSNILKNCSVTLIADIIPTVISTLIIELYERKGKNVYSSDDIYDDFCNDLKKPETLNELAHKYPCMFSLVYETAERRAGYIGSCIGNIYNNKEIIEKTLCTNFEYITGIRVTNGDSHNGGKKVIIIETDGGKFVYKPHSLDPEKVFEKIICNINNSCLLKYDLKCAAVCSFDDFGIQEFIAQRSIDSEHEAERYFYRIGAFSAIFDAIACEDLHYENIICSGEYPYFVDLETLIKNSRNDGDVLKDHDFLKQSLGELTDSVLGTMIFPLNTTVAFIDMDVAGISGSSYGKSKKWKSFDLINAGTDKIRFVQKEGHADDAGNLLICNGKEVNPVYFVEEIIDGYSDAVNVLKKKSEDILSDIYNSNMIIRRVLRPTAFYGKFLQVSYAPKFYTSDELRIKLFSKLNTHFENDEKERKRIILEVKALMRNDIPLFRQNVCSNDIIADDSVIENYNEHTPYESVARQFEKIDDAYIKKQKNYIRMSISTNYRADDERENFGRHLPNEKLVLSTDLLEAAEKIAEHICETTIESADGRFMAWYTETSSDRYLLDICNTKIYDGGGNILFFLSLWKCTQNQKWLDIAKKGLNGFEELGLIKDIKDISLFVGTVGTLYILYWLYSFTGENEYLEKLEGHAEKVLEKLPELQMKVDLVSGLSGAVTALVRINKNVHVKAIDEILDVIGNKLFNMVENDELPFMTGFAHGYAGISLALAEYGAHISNKRFIELAEKLVEKENSYSSEKEENWLDLRKENAFGAYWCHGAPGIALSRLMIKDLIDINVDRDIEWGIKCLMTRGLSDELDHCLCHGVFGSIDMLITFGKKLGNNELIKAAEKAADKFIVDIEKNGFKSGLASMPAVPSFMTGISGVGYELLRVYDNSLPSVNAIEVRKLWRDQFESRKQSDN